MKVLAILGSPRVNKNTDTLLNQVLKGIEKCTLNIKKVELGKLDINPCKACYNCGITGKCIFNDAMVDLYYEFDKSDVIIIASPLYFNSVTSITKTMIDRCQALYASKYILKKPSINRNKKRIGIFISTAGSKLNEDGFIGAKVVMKLFFKSINTEYYKNIYVDNTDKIYITNRKDILKKAFNIGEELCN